MTVTIANCLACLEETSVDADQLCEFHALQNASLDGTLLALLLHDGKAAE